MMDVVEAIVASRKRIPVVIEKDPRGKWYIAELHIINERGAPERIFADLVDFENRKGPVARIENLLLSPPRKQEGWVSLVIMQHKQGRITL